MIEAALGSEMAWTSVQAIMGGAEGLEPLIPTLPARSGIVWGVRG